MAQSAEEKRRAPRHPYAYSVTYMGRVSTPGAPDQDGPDSRLGHPPHIVPREDPTLAHDQLVPGNTLGQPKRHSKGCHERGEVTVVDSDDPGFGEPFEHQVQLPLMVHLE